MAEGQYPYYAPLPLLPHRGPMVLTFGLIGIFCCVILGILAWVFGSEDLRAMNEGRMDPSGRGLTQAGQVCGIISVVLTVLGFIAMFALMIIGALAPEAFD